MHNKTKVLIVVLLFSLAVTANATPMRTAHPLVELTFSGTTANCSVMVTSADEKLNVTLELWHGDTLVASWSASGNDSIVMKKSCQVTKGETYTLIATGTANGKPFDSSSVTKKC